MFVVFKTGLQNFRVLPSPPLSEKQETAPFFFHPSALDRDNPPALCIGLLPNAMQCNAITCCSTHMHTCPVMGVHLLMNHTETRPDQTTTYTYIAYRLPAPVCSIARSSFQKLQKMHRYGQYVKYHISSRRFVFQSHPSCFPFFSYSSSFVDLILSSRLPLDRSGFVLIFLLEALDHRTHDTTEAFLIRMVG